VTVRPSDEAHRAAHRGAYDIFEGVQSDEREAVLARLPGARAEAIRHSWFDVEFVLDAAAALDAIIHSADKHPTLVEPEALVDLLVGRAEAIGSPALQALALGLRAVAAANDDKAAAVRDAARATALLDDDDQSPLDRCVGYVVAAAAFNTLRLWELVDELYTRALEFGAVSRETRQTAAIAVNRVLTRLEWALAAVEHGDSAQRDDGPDVDAESSAQRAGELLDAVLDVVPQALAEQLPALWRLNVLACADIAAMLRGSRLDEVLGRINEQRRLLAEAGDIEVLPILEAAIALALWRGGRRDDAIAAALRVTPATSVSSGAQTFPLWARAHVLAAAEPSTATSAQRDHSRAIVQLVWQSRMTVLAAARAQIVVEQRKREHEALAHAVNTDPLTGLSNRRRFEMWLQRPAAELRPGTVLLLIDVDDFKEVNDRFGHDCGDQVLRVVAALMASSVRADDVAIRHGGDEFALILDGDELSVDAVIERAERLGAAVSDTRWADIEPGLNVSISIGAALCRRRSEPPTVEPVTLYKVADAALYRAKRSRSRIALSEV
jgi:diguanylate cyclase (GGDEF)-like protein